MRVIENVFNDALKPMGEYYCSDYFKACLMYEVWTNTKSFAEWEDFIAKNKPSASIIALAMLEAATRPQQQKSKKQKWWTKPLYMAAQKLRQEGKTAKDAFDSILTSGLSIYDFEIENDGGRIVVVSAIDKKGESKPVSFDTFKRNYWPKKRQQ